MSLRGRFPLLAFSADDRSICVSSVDLPTDLPQSINLVAALCPVCNEWLTRPFTFGVGDVLFPISKESNQPTLTTPRHEMKASRMSRTNPIMIRSNSHSTKTSYEEFSPLSRANSPSVTQTSPDVSSRRFFSGVETHLRQQSMVLDCIRRENIGIPHKSSVDYGIDRPPTVGGWPR